MRVVAGVDAVSTCASEDDYYIRETSNLSTDADCRTDTILESLRDLSKKKKWGG